jgi:hypothetical protein
MSCLTPYLVQDACHLIARAVAANSARGGDIFNSSALAQFIINERYIGDDAPYGQLVGGPYRFQTRTGERIGAFDILNTYMSNGTGNMIKIGEVNFPDGPKGAADGWVDFNTPGVKFASKEMTSLISSTKRPRIILGFLYLNTTATAGNPNGAHPQAPAWLAWLEVAKLAASHATVEDASVLKGFEINITSLDCLGFVADTVAKCARGLLAQSSMAILAPVLERDVRFIARILEKRKLFIFLFSYCAHVYFLNVSFTAHTSTLPLVSWAASGDELADPESFDNFLRFSASDSATASATVAEVRETLP